jgi:hypothetical protein
VVFEQLLTITFSGYKELRQFGEGKFSCHFGRPREERDQRLKIKMQNFGIRQAADGYFSVIILAGLMGRFQRKRREGWF